MLYDQGRCETDANVAHTFHIRGRREMTSLLASFRIRILTEKPTSLRWHTYSVPPDVVCAQCPQAAREFGPLAELLDGSSIAAGCRSASSKTSTGEASLN